MNYIKVFCLFWYDFIVGDDWVIAAGVIIALFGISRLIRVGINAWWLMPGAVVILLAISLWRLTHKSIRRRPTSRPTARRKQPSVTPP
ncbi:MAG: hypothetical protein QOI66_2031 [Myxococcales bacterium]|nr:hypothetical protein [Myxococcales bacterium]